MMTEALPSAREQARTGTAILHALEKHGAPIARASLWEEIRETANRRTIQLAFQTLMSRGCIYETPDMKIAVVSDHDSLHAPVA